MSDDDRRPEGGDRTGPGEPRRNWLRRIVERGPAERRQLGDAVAWLLGTALVAMAAIGGLVIWHLIRRGRILRDRLEPPKVVRLPDLEDLNGGHHDHDAPHDALPPA